MYFYMLVFNSVGGEVMSVIINPKFKIGQEVYMISPVCECCPVYDRVCDLKCNDLGEKAVIKKTVINYCVSLIGDSFKVSYGIQFESSFRFIDENELFETKEDAEKYVS